ncbi:MAG: flavin reductase [Dehalococcoidia bacterium]|nr:flavin reductase [Dehalococcoidia bacterium]
MSRETALDQRLFRDVAGCFATGVTVATLNVDGEFRGMTANAFTSLSLDPPLVLLCVARTASAHDFFERADAFGVNILAEDQRPLSVLFAAHGPLEQPMGGVPFREGELGSPLLEGALAFVEARIVERYQGGDHTILVGEVVDLGYSGSGKAPLLFFSGRYRHMGDEVEA